MLHQELRARADAAWEEGRGPPTQGPDNPPAAITPSMVLAQAGTWDLTPDSGTRPLTLRLDPGT